MSEDIILLNESDFDSNIATGVSLVDFWAEWCGPCRMQGPILEKVAKDVKGKAKIMKINIDDSPNLANKFNVHSIPTLIIFKDGKEVQRFVGLQQQKSLVSSLNSHTK